MKIRRATRTGLLVTLSVVAPLFAGAALAQPDSAKDDPAEGRVSEILVTALRSEPIATSRAPIAVTAFSGEDLEARGATSFVDFLQEAPGVSLVPSTFGTLDIQIRGLSSRIGDSLVGYYVDEAPFSRLSSTNLPDFNFFDLDRVEVLRGPQGTLYGAGASGGVIRILTKDPQIGLYAAKGELGISSFTGGEVSKFANLAANVPLGEDAALRLTGSVNDIGGYIDYPVLGRTDANDSQTENYRGKFLWQPRDNISVVLSATHNAADADAQNTSERGWVSQKGLSEVSETADDYYSGVIKWGGGAFNVVSSTSFVKSHFMSANDFLSLPFILEFDYDYFIQEVRLNSTGDGDWRWTAGIYYADREQRRRQDATAVLGPAAFALERDTSESVAAFGDLTRLFADGRVHVSLGARYWSEEKSISDLTNENAPAVKQSYDNISPRLNIAYLPNRDNTFYINVSEGFRSGLIQSPIQVTFSRFFGVELPAGADPETLWAYELGYKGRFSNGRLLLEAAAYVNDWKNRLVSVGVVRNVSAGYFNAGSSTIPGIEWSLRAIPNESVSFGLSGQWNDARYSQTVKVNVLDPASGMFVPEIVVEEGARIDLVPEWTLNGDVQLQRDFGPYRGFMTLRAAYTDKRYATQVGVRLASDSVTRVDFRMGVETQRWGVNLFVENLTNEDGIVTPTFGEGYAYSPRSAGVEFKARL